MVDMLRDVRPQRAQEDRSVQAAALSLFAVLIFFTMLDRFP